ncbi:hypothetical protein NF212_06010 [Parasalinivibrio latis]|uniref:hypothetical protein n=1 Tax=Parasalinivibrio latis TaxID=2952610 RepID=UPI0030E16679
MTNLVLFCATMVLIAGYAIFKGLRPRQSSFIQMIILLRELIQLIRIRRQLWRPGKLKLESPDTRLSRIDTSISSVIVKLRSTCDSRQQTLINVLSQRVLELQDLALDCNPTTAYLRHGKLIRHLLYLIDECTFSMIEGKEGDITINEYQIFWQSTLDSMDSLTRFRMAVLKIDKGEFSGIQSLRLQALILRKRLSKTEKLPGHSQTAISPLLYRQLSDIYHNYPEELTMTVEALWGLSDQTSTVIFTQYDQQLQQTLKSADIELPPLLTPSLN